MRAKDLSSTEEDDEAACALSKLVSPNQSNPDTESRVIMELVLDHQ